MPYTKKGEQRNTGRTHFKKGNAGYWLGKKRPLLRHDKQFQKGQVVWNKGKKGEYSESLRKKMSEAQLLRFSKSSSWNKGNVGFLAGEKHYKWIKDRTQLKKSNDTIRDRRSYAYKDWRKQVWTRDNWKCRINNQDCIGRIEAHHILGFTKFPLLRYDINNGITLCHYHHPLSRKDEINLSPYFQELVRNIQ